MGGQGERGRVEGGSQRASRRQAGRSGSLLVLYAVLFSHPPVRSVLYSVQRRIMVLRDPEVL